MWIRDKETGTCRFEQDLAEAFAQLDAGTHEGVGALPPRPAAAAEVAPAAKAAPRRRKAAD